MIESMLQQGLSNFFPSKRKGEVFGSKGIISVPYFTYSIQETSLPEAVIVSMQTKNVRSPTTLLHQTIKYLSSLRRGSFLQNN